jgi:hypothetical protein
MGRHPKGSTPLTTISDVLVNLVRLSLYGGMPEAAGAKSTKCKEPPRATPQFPVRISTEHFFTDFFMAGNQAIHNIHLDRD